MRETSDKRNVAVASDRLYRAVRDVIQEAHGVVSRVANWAMVEANWRVGFLIVEDEQKGKRKAEYGKAVLRDLARRLTAEYGSGYDESNLRYMRLFYLAFPIRDALRHELSYNSILKCYFLIDLKVGRVTHQDVGQMDMYRRMYDELVKQPDDNPTIGLVLCSETDQAIARYSILKGNEQLFAVKYKTYLPDEETLRREIEAQKELYRLQVQEAKEIEALMSPVHLKRKASSAKKAGKAKREKRVKRP